MFNIMPVSDTRPALEYSWFSVPPKSPCSVRFRTSEAILLVTRALRPIEKGLAPPEPSASPSLYRIEVWDVNVTDFHRCGRVM